MEITLNQVDVAKLNLGPDDTLIVTVRDQEFLTSGLGNFADLLRETFYQNKVVVIGLGPDNDIKFTTVREKQQNYCSDCNCGKKEAAENDLS